MWHPTAQENLNKSKGNVSTVIKRTERDEEGVYYSVCVRLRNCPGAFEQGEDELYIWGMHIEFGTSPAFRAGGHAFVEASIEQDRVSREVWEQTR